MVKAEKMQRAVDDEMGPVGHEGLLLLLCLARDYGCADDEVPQQRRREVGTEFGRGYKGESEHVGRRCFAPIRLIELVAFKDPDDANNELHRMVVVHRIKGSAGPAFKLGLGR